MDGGGYQDAHPAIPFTGAQALQHPGQLAQFAGSKLVLSSLPQLLADPEREDSGFHHQKFDGGHQVARVPRRGLFSCFLFFYYYVSLCFYLFRGRLKKNLAEMFKI